jgi:RNA polymerase sigma factor (sigma-70 family)
MQPFEDVVIEHGPVVLRVCRAMLGPSDADDVWSETFLAALRAYPDLRADSNVRGWLVTIAHRKAIDHLRRRGRVAIPTAAVPDRLVDGSPPVPDDELRLALACLPSKQHDAVVYRYLADLPYAEVARLLGTSEAAARRNTADGIRSLRRRYRQEEVQ